MVSFLSVLYHNVCGNDEIYKIKNHYRSSVARDPKDKRYDLIIEHTGVSMYQYPAKVPVEEQIAQYYGNICGNHLLFLMACGDRALW